eukprot:s755_g17.t1
MLDAGSAVHGPLGPSLSAYSAAAPHSTASPRTPNYKAARPQRAEPRIALLEPSATSATALWRKEEKTHLFCTEAIKAKYADFERRSPRCHTPRAQRIARPRPQRVARETCTARAAWLPVELHAERLGPVTTRSECAVMPAEPPASSQTQGTKRPRKQRTLQGLG